LGAGVPLRLQPEKLFGRHCGIFGATGGGKSWTLATVLGQIKACKGKAILFDPTGEFADLPEVDHHYAFDGNELGTTLIHFPYRQMTEDDLFALFRPFGQIQGPKLREAVRSLKLVTIVGGQSQTLPIYQGRVLTKRGQGRPAFFSELNLRKVDLHNPLCNFKIEDLSENFFQKCSLRANTREILMNVIGRHILTCARAGMFRERPVIVILDEAHQFLGRIIGDEYANVRLESFGLTQKKKKIWAHLRTRDTAPSRYTAGRAEPAWHLSCSSTNQ
jgi:energy-coupling factor transporter ATP-binding protein EcfA2